LTRTVKGLVIPMSMKVGGVGSVRSGITRRTKSKTSGGTGGFEIGAAASEPSIAPATSTAGTTPVGALLAVQEVSDATDERKRAVSRGRDLLQELEQLHLGLLLGSIPRNRLEKLMRMLTERRGAYADPKLSGIIAEIEVRAAVELAKFERSGLGRH
jgi:hypothetical protein